MKECIAFLLHASQTLFKDHDPMGGEFVIVRLV